MQAVRALHTSASARMVVGLRSLAAAALSTRADFPESWPNGDEKRAGGRKVRKGAEANARWCKARRKRFADRDANRNNSGTKKREVQELTDHLTQVQRWQKKALREAAQATLAAMPAAEDDDDEML